MQGRKSCGDDRYGGPAATEPPRRSEMLRSQGAEGRLTDISDSGRAVAAGVGNYGYFVAA